MPTTVRRRLNGASARTRGMTTIALTGLRGQDFAAMADHGLVAPSEETPRVQEVHLVWGHAWCDAVDRIWSDGDTTGRAGGRDR